MMRVSKWRRRVVHWALGIISAWVLAYPASAETTTLVCEGEHHDFLDFSPPVPWHASVDIDYTAGRISVPVLTIPTLQLAKGVAVISDRDIKFESPNQGQIPTVGYPIYKGVIDRLSGRMDLVFRWRPDAETGAYDKATISARCRPAMQKF